MWTLLPLLTLASDMVDEWDYPPDGINVRDTPFAEVVALGDLVIFGTLVEERADIFLGVATPQTVRAWVVRVDRVLQGSAAQVGDPLVIDVEWAWPPEVSPGDPVAAVLSYKVPYRYTKHDNPSRTAATAHIVPFADRWMPTAGGSLFVHCAVYDLPIRALGPKPAWLERSDWALFQEQFITEGELVP